MFAQENSLTRSHLIDQARKMRLGFLHINDFHHANLV
jgi:hypothetical protein